MNKRPWAFIVLLLLVVWVVYLPMLKNQLIWDDKPMIEKNDLLQTPHSLLAPFRYSYWSTTIVRGGGDAYYRPLTILSYMMEIKIWGISPIRLKQVNLFFFSIGLWVLYLLFRRQGFPGNEPEIAILLFAFFPLHMDNINWVVGRCDLLMFAGGVSSLLLFDHFLEKKKLLTGILSLLFFILAVLAKEAALFFFPLFILYGWYKTKRFSICFHLLQLSMILGYSWIKASIIHRSGYPFRFFSEWAKNLTLPLGALGYYARCLFFPFDYPMFLPADQVNRFLYVLAGAAFVSLLIFLAWKWNSAKAIRFSLTFIAVFSFGHLAMIFTPVFPFSISSRYLLNALIGLSILMAFFFEYFQGRIKTVILVGLLGFFIVSLHFQSQIYADEFRFWETAARHSPQNGFILSQFAKSLAKNGEVIESEIIFHRVLKTSMNPTTAVSVALNLADIAWKQCDYPQMRLWLDRIQNIPGDLSDETEKSDLIRKLGSALGDVSSTEKLLLSSWQKWNAPEILRILFDLYMASNQWEKAYTVAGKLDSKGKSVLQSFVRTYQTQFQTYTPGQKIRYWLDWENFSDAWIWLSRNPESYPGGIFFRWKIAYRAGFSQEAKKEILSFLEKKNSEPSTANAMGIFYWKELYRPKEALPFFHLSLTRNPNQPGLSRLIRKLENLEKQRAESQP